MLKKDIIKAYASFRCTVQKYKLNVVTPKLFNNVKKYTVSGLSMVFFYLNIGKIKTKVDLLTFLRDHGCCLVGHPHPRHFGMQYGFHFLIQDAYHPRYRRHLKAGEYSLYSLTRCHPNRLKGTTSHRTSTVTKPIFEKLKGDYASRCAVCGSKEGERSFKNNTIITRLEKGHCDPQLPLDIQNCIPICKYCNSVYKNSFIFNKRGIIVKVNQLDSN
jgi:hypothetical protein